MKPYYLLTVLLISFSLQSKVESKMHLKQGILCSVEGIDGSGKTTFITNLIEQLNQIFDSVVTTKEPGGTSLGKELRAMLMNKTTKVSTLAEFLLFAADRSQHFEELIIPHLKNGSIIVSDRMADSSLVYQGYLKGLDKSVIDHVNRLAMQNIDPDIVFYLKIDPQIAVERIGQRKNIVAFEHEILSKSEEISDGFNDIFKDRDNVVILDATLPSEQIAQQAVEKIIEIIKVTEL